MLIEANQPDLRVRFKFKDVEYNLSMQESTDLEFEIRAARHALKVKCTTCRCLIYPNQGCGCCA